MKSHNLRQQSYKYSNTDNNISLKRNELEPIISEESVLELLDCLLHLLHCLCTIFNPWMQRGKHYIIVLDAESLLMRFTHAQTIMIIHFQHSQCCCCWLSFFRNSSKICEQKSFNSFIKEHVSPIIRTRCNTGQNQPLTQCNASAYSLLM